MRFSSPSFYRLLTFLVSFLVNIALFVTFKWLHREAWLIFVSLLTCFFSGLIVRYLHPKSPWWFGLVYGSLVAFLLMVISVLLVFLHVPGL